MKFLQTTFLMTAVCVVVACSIKKPTNPMIQNRHHRIFFSEIELIERLPSKYVRLHTKEMNMVLPGSLISFLHQLPEDRFQRVSDGLWFLQTARARSARTHLRDASYR